MWKPLTSVENLANRVVIWVTAFGILTGVFTWISAQLSFLQPHSWAEAVLMGFLLASVAILVLSAALAAWRYFRPLPNLDGRQQAKTGAVAQAPSTAARDIDRSLLLLFKWGVDLIYVTTMIELVKESPYFDDESATGDATKHLTEMDAGRNFLGRVRSELVGSRWAYDLSVVIQDAEREAEQEMRNLPREEWPDRDLLSLRDYRMVRTQSGRVVDFLQRKIDEAPSEYRQYRQMFQGQLRHLDKQD